MVRSSESEPEFAWDGERLGAHRGKRTAKSLCTALAHHPPRQPERQLELEAPILTRPGRQRNQRQGTARFWYNACGKKGSVCLIPQGSARAGRPRSFEHVQAPHLPAALSISAPHVTHTAKVLQHSTGRNLTQETAISVQFAPGMWFLVLDFGGKGGT
eukprot:3272111-Rhodomonas_salina.1